jgi:hypothetical protein
MGNSSLVSINFGNPDALPSVMSALNSTPVAQQQTSPMAGGQPISMQNGPTNDMFQRSMGQQPAQNQSPFFLPVEAAPKQQLESAYLSVLQSRSALDSAQQNYNAIAKQYEELGKYLEKRSFQDQAIGSLLQSRQQQEAAASGLASPPPTPIGTKLPLADMGNPAAAQSHATPPINPTSPQPNPQAMPQAQQGQTPSQPNAAPQPSPLDPGIQQQADQAQQQYFQDLSRMRAEQLQQQQQMTPPPSPQGMPSQGQQPGMPPQGPPPTLPPQPQMSPQGQMLPTPPQTPPGSPQQPMHTDLPPQAGMQPQSQGGMFPFEQMNQVLIQADPASRWSALEQIGKQKSGPPYIYNTLRLMAMPASPLLPASFTPDEKRGLQEASFWTLALLNTSQNAQVPVSIALKDPTGKAVKDPKTGAPLYQFLPGLEEASATLSSKKNDPQIQRAAIQFLHEIMQVHPNDPTLVGILSSAQSRDPSVRALAKQTARSILPPLPSAQPQPAGPGGNSPNNPMPLTA